MPSEVFCLGGTEPQFFFAVIVVAEQLAKDTLPARLHNEAIAINGFRPILVGIIQDNGPSVHAGAEFGFGDHDGCSFSRCLPSSLTITPFFLILESV
jgi:hypothetical protein